MSFILKNNPTIINIKLTSVGRQLLSKGKLNMTKWAIGDSEIDYSFSKKISFDPFMENILRPKDQNPKFSSFILQNGTDLNSKYTSLPTVVSNTNVVANTATLRGFFTKDTTKLLVDALRMKQADMQVFISTLTGGTILKIRKSPTYLSNPTEPIVGDYILVRWANPLILGGTVTPSLVLATPHIWYKIESIRSGKLSTDNLIIGVDKQLPNFGALGGTIASGVFLYPNSNNRSVSGDSIQSYYSTPYVSDFISDSVISFFENCICPVRDVPVWNMSIVFTEEIAGVKSTDRNISQYYTKGYGGFVQYIERISPKVKNVGIIHFTNSSPSNHYGEGFLLKTPILDLPTIMWHHETGGTMGLRLTSYGSEKILDTLNIVYYDLADKYGNIVGKIFNDLKIFLIEDQELLFAMSYKSNRSWTLPRPSAGFNLQLNNCSGVCLLKPPTIIKTQETSFGAKNATITITPNGGQGDIFYSIDGGLTYKTTPTFTGLGSGTYNVVVLDTVIQNCSISTVVTIAAVTTTQPPITTIAGTTAVATTAAVTTAAVTTAAVTTAAVTTLAVTTPAPTFLVAGKFLNGLPNSWKFNFNDFGGSVQTNILTTAPSQFGNITKTLHGNTVNGTVTKLTNGGLVENGLTVTFYKNGIFVGQSSGLVDGSAGIAAFNFTAFNGDVLSMEVYENLPPPPPPPCIAYDFVNNSDISTMTVQYQDCAGFTTTLVILAGGLASGICCLVGSISIVDGAGTITENPTLQFLCNGTTTTAAPVTTLPPPPALGCDQYRIVENSDSNPLLIQYLDCFGGTQNFTINPGGTITLCAQTDTIIFISGTGGITLLAAC
jgi:hypothetical protein